MAEAGLLGDERDAVTVGEVPWRDCVACSGRRCGGIGGRSGPRAPRALRSRELLGSSARFSASSPALLAVGSRFLRGLVLLEVGRGRAPGTWPRRRRRTMLRAAPSRAGDVARPQALRSTLISGRPRCRRSAVRAGRRRSRPWPRGRRRPCAARCGSSEAIAVGRDVHRADPLRKIESGRDEHHALPVEAQGGAHGETARELGVELVDRGRRSAHGRGLVHEDV